MTRYYENTSFTFEEPENWTLEHVLRHYAASQPDATLLKTPAEGLQRTYAEMLGSAERIAGALVAEGGQYGDRVIIMAFNSSRFVRTWFGTALAGMAEVPINTSYEGEFLRHQVATVGARWAVIDDVFAERWVAVAEHARGVEKFWVIDTGRGSEAVELLRSHGWQAEQWEALEEGPVLDLPTPKAQDLGAIFFTSGTTGPSKGVAMPHSHLYFFAQEVVNLTQLTNVDTYLTTTPLFHGNAQFMAVYPALVAGATAAVRPKFSASKWIDPWEYQNQ